MFKKNSLVHGGELRRKKIRRPLDTKRPIHLVLKARHSILRKHEKFIKENFYKWGQKYNLKIYGLSVVHNHVHAAVRFRFRRDYLAFIRALTGAIAKKLGKGLWKFLPFTRVISWGRDLKILAAYIWQNEFEARGLVQYRARYRRELKLSG